MDDKSAIQGVSTDDAQVMSEGDLALREAVEKNKREAVASGHAEMPPPDRVAKVRRAQELRIKLGGFGELSPEVRKSGDIRDTVWPLVREYVSIRLHLAVESTVHALHVELGVTQAEMSEILAVEETASAEPDPGVARAMAALAAGLKLVEKQVAALADVVAKLTGQTGA